MVVLKWILASPAASFLAGLLSVHGTAVAYTRPSWHYETDVLGDGIRPNRRDAFPTVGSTAKRGTAKPKQ